jgi:hypothetical protein
VAERRRWRERRLPPVVAASDCERCRPGPVTQPANTASSLAYVAAGAVALAEARRHPADRRPGTPAVGWSLVAVGLGSVAYHGPGGVLGRWAHDASLLAMTGLIALSDLHHGRGTPPAAAEIAAVTAVAGAAAHPRTSAAAQAVAAAGALVAEVHRHLAEGHDDRRDVLAAAVFAAGLGLHVAGRTGRPLCRPDSALQAHAAWHVLSAAAMWLRTRPAAPAGVSPRGRW